MKIVLQRVSSANVKVNNKIISTIDKGLVVLVGFTHDDNEPIIKAMAEKVINLRVFDDEKMIPNINILSLKDTHSILSISQFTLYADCRRGKRPDYLKAAKASLANEYYNKFNNYLRDLGVNTKTGVFQADMQISLVNDGPYTLILESRDLFPKLYL